MLSFDSFVFVRTYEFEVVSETVLRPQRRERENAAKHSLLMDNTVALANKAFLMMFSQMCIQLIITEEAFVAEFTQRMDAPFDLSFSWLLPRMMP